MASDFPKVVVVVERTHPKTDEIALMCYPFANKGTRRHFPDKSLNAKAGDIILVERVEDVKGASIVYGTIDNTRMVVAFRSRGFTTPSGVTGYWRDGVYHSDGSFGTQCVSAPEESSIEAITLGIDGPRWHTGDLAWEQSGLWLIKRGAEDFEEARIHEAAIWSKFEYIVDNYNDRGNHVRDIVRAANFAKHPELDSLEKHVAFFEGRYGVVSAILHGKFSWMCWNIDRIERLEGSKWREDRTHDIEGAMNTVLTACGAREYAFAGGQAHYDGIANPYRPYLLQHFKTQADVTRKKVNEILTQYANEISFPEITG